MTRPPDWPEADVMQASKLWLDGMTAGQISKAMDYRYTRNAILGKLNRIGLARNPSVTQPKRGRHKPMPIEQRIMQKHRERQLPTSIANMLKIPTAQVLEIMDRLGIDPRDNVIEPYRVHPMWAMGEDDRRQAFYEKFSKGWEGVQRRLKHDV